MLKHAKRIAISIVGMTVLLFGIALIVLPGPAIVVIPIGLAILATEFAWARHWLNVMRESAEKGAEKLTLRTLFSRKSNPKGQDIPAE
jgi:tellurite resistance protein TerC